MSWQEEDFSQSKISLKIWKKILLLLSEHRRLFFLLIVVMICVAATDVAIPFINKIIIDNFVGQNFDVSDLALVAGINLIVIIVQTILIYCFFRLAGDLEMGFSYSLRKLAFKKLQELSFSYFDKTANGWIIARIGNDVTRLSEVVGWSLVDFAWGGSVILFICSVMFMVNWQLALIVVSVVPVIIIVSFKFQKLIYRKMQETRKQNSLITAAYAEGIYGAKTSKSLALEEQNSKEFFALSGVMRKKSIKSKIYNSLFYPIIVSLSTVSMGLLLWQGGNQMLAGFLTAGTLVMFVQYSMQFFEPIGQIARVLSDLQMAQTSAERVISLLETEVDVVDSPEVIEKYGTIWQPKEENYPTLVGDIEFKNIDFHYNIKEPILKNFNLKVKAGETIALVGETGSGKSTIVNMLCRFYEPISGEILIDGVEYRQRSLAWLHSNIGYVLQDPHLFDDTIKENIRFGNKSISDEKVQEYATLVHAHEFISELAEGYNSKVGEGGSKLSSGQKQLISFARALCADPSILILDEATSSIDSENEHLIQKAIDFILEGRTCFIVAHRLSTIVNADKILVLKKGVIQEVGNFNELMAAKKDFYKLYTKQKYEKLEEKILKG
ncbi:MAG: ABC transporter ATP-binding protein [Erysipelotrichaceae bacterium]